MNPDGILHNRVLLTVLAAWFSAQTLKIPIEYFRTRRWNWALFFAPGGMPSSHSALVTATALGIGLHIGFDSPLFALAIAMAMIVVYDATGIRRQAGMQAQKINVLVEELLKGHPISEQQLREVLGHTPIEAVGGILLGLVVATGMWFLWH
jgi:uncharacterized protein